MHFVATKSPTAINAGDRPDSILDSANPVRVQIWTPDYEASMGGIQIFTKFFVRALGDCLPDAESSLFCKNDKSHPTLPGRGVRTSFYCAGRWPHSVRTPAFSAKLIFHAFRQRPNLILSTHVNFTPVASVLNRVAGIPYAAVAHGIDVWGPSRRRGLGGALRRASCVMAVSHFTRDRIVADLGLSP